MTLLVKASSRAEDNQYGGAMQADLLFRSNTSAVLGAYADEAFEGVGTLEADRRAAAVEEAKRTGTPIGFEDYKQSEYYRPGIGYFGGMTKEAAQILAENYDETAARSEIIARASTGQNIAGFAVALGAGTFEPKNLGIGIATSVALGPFGFAAPAVSRTRALANMRRFGGKYGALAGRGATEGLVAAAVAEPSNRHSASILQQDYTMADSLFNVATSSLFGAAFNTAPAFIKDRFFSAPDKVKAFDATLAELDTATQQLTQGQRIDVGAVEKANIGEIARKPIAEKASAVEQFVRYTETPEFKTRFEGSKVVDEQGAPLRVYHGTNSDFQEFITKGKKASGGELGTGAYFTDAEAASKYATARREDGANVRLVYLNIKNPFDVTGLDDIPSRQQLVKRGFDGIIDRGGVDRGIKREPQYVAFSPDQIISAFGADDMDSIAKRLDAENKASLQKSIKDAADPLNDTAIDRNAIDTLNTIEKNMEAQDALKQYEEYAAEIDQLEKQGIATAKAELQEALDSMNEADIEEAYNALYACLTRG